MNAYNPTPLLDSLLNSEQQQEIVNALNSGHPHIPAKFSYLWEESLREYWTAKEEKRLEQAKKKPQPPHLSFNQQHEPFNYLLQPAWKGKKVAVIDFGCGSGRPFKKLNEELRANNQDIAYIPVEYSEVFVKILQENYETWLPNLPIKPVFTDWEADNFAESVKNTIDTLPEDTIRLYACVGATTSNLPQLSSFLKGIQTLLRPQDFFLVDTPQPFGFTSRDVSYFHQEMDWRKGILTNMGIPSDLLSHEIYYNEELNRKYIGVEVLEDARLTSSQQLEYELILPKGMKIELIRSQQYTVPQFSEKLLEAALHIKGYYSANEGFRGVYLVQK